MQRIDMIETAVFSRHTQSRVVHRRVAVGPLGVGLALQRLSVTLGPRTPDPGGWLALDVIAVCL
jgi:hypothetical protein